MDYSNRSLCPLSSSSVQLLRDTGQESEGSQKKSDTEIYILSLSPFQVSMGWLFSSTKGLQFLSGGTCSLRVLVVAVPDPGVLHHLLLTSPSLTLIFVNSPFINLSLINYVNMSSISHQNSD